MLTTTRLLLRPPSIDDFEPYHAAVGTPPSRLGPDAPPSREDSYKRLLSNIACWTVFGFGSFIVVERSSEQLVGSCGVFRMERDVDPPLDGSPEAGWSIASGFQGRGFAYESMSAILDWFDIAVGIRRTVCMIDVGNAASEKLAEKLGYIPIATARYQEIEVINYVRSSG